MPDRLLLTYYGDDFTGSTDVLEALTLAGLKAMLFMEPPSPSTLADYPGLDAIGVAGISRSRSPDWMDAHLPEIFSALMRLGARICHYKTCSTFDSAPHVGSIGRAIEIGQDVFATPCVPVIVGVTGHRRWVFFGTLFAGFGDAVYRIDRHPVMSRHPVTPMHEADLTLHLTAQTSRRIVSVGSPALLDGEMPAGAEVAVLDTHDEATSAAAGGVVWRLSQERPLFVAGSSGVEYALVDHMRIVGELGPPPERPRAAAVAQIAVASGSASTVTQRQIEWAEANGFSGVPLDPVAMIERPVAERGRAIARAREALKRGQSVVLHTAAGPDDARIGATRDALARAGLPPTQSAERLGVELGLILAKVARASQLERVILAGGDSSGYAAGGLGVEALEMVAPLVPGSPLCRARSRDARLDGIGIVMKGGQVGGADYFEAVRQGRV